MEIAYFFHNIIFSILIFFAIPCAIILNSPILKKGNSTAVNRDKNFWDNTSL